MRMLTWTMLAAFVAVLPAVGAKADMEAKPGSAQAGDWVKRMPVTPNPDKVVVPPGYKVGVFKAGLDTPSTRTIICGSPFPARRSTRSTRSIRRTSRFSTREEP